MRITSCRFECSAHDAGSEPRTRGPEVVFLGRSNVGKSSLINRLLGTRGLARTSSRPGRTQSVNFYRVNESYNFIDLPGYGYAKVPEKIRQTWGPMIEGFLERHRKRIAMAVLVIDARRRPTELDGVMRDWLEAKEIEYRVAATKSDKLSGNGRAAAIGALNEHFGGADRMEPILVSAHTGLGIRELWRHLDQALADANRQEGRAWTSKS